MNDRDLNPAYYDTLAAARGITPAPARSWSILLTSANHGTVGPLGSTFPHAGEHHERVVVVEVPAAAGAPSDEVNLVLRAAPAAQAGQVAVPETIHSQEFHELAMDYRAAPLFGAHQAYAAMVAHIDARLGAQASTAGERQPEGGAA